MMTNEVTHATANSTMHCAWHWWDKGDPEGGHVIGKGDPVVGFPPDRFDKSPRTMWYCARHAEIRMKAEKDGIAIVY